MGVKKKQSGKRRRNNGAISPNERKESDDEEAEEGRQGDGAAVALTESRGAHGYIPALRRAFSQPHTVI